MRDKFIKLTDVDGRDLFVNTFTISCVKANGNCSFIYLFTSDSYISVTETPEEIMKKIKDSESFKFTM
jgi:uncharacterized protein YlzI (FlbEa/FlbD family)